MRRTQGGQANYTGKMLENYVATRIEEAYRRVSPTQFPMLKVSDDFIYCQQYPLCESIYKTQIKCDFILFSRSKWPDALVIETKWQESGGSVDEKFPYLCLNIKHQYQVPTIIVLDGRGYKPGASKWLRAQAGDGNLIHVFDMIEFQKWVNSGSLH